MNDTCALTFRNDGKVDGLYTELIDLSALGDLHIERATRIEFDNVRGAWRVYDLTGFPMCSDPSRTQCLEWERQYFESQEDTKHELPPGTDTVATGSGELG